MNYKKLAIAIIVSVLYFCIQTQVDWQSITPSSWSISISYLFDLIFITSWLFLDKWNHLVGKMNLKGLLTRFVIILVVSISSVKIIDFNDSLNSPFSYVQSLFVHILILAPFIEEFIFRGIIYKLFAISKLRASLNVIINSLLFSLSHLPAYFILPKQFHSFVIFQLCYTLILGWVCSKSRERTNGVLEPIILHFTFNFVFYLWITKV